MIEVGSVLWVQPNSPPLNPSDNGHFAVILAIKGEVGDEDVLWATLSTVKPGRYYDKTCEFLMPHRVLKRGHKPRKQYVCYWRARLIGIGAFEHVTPRGKLYPEQIEAAAAGLNKTDELPDDLVEFVQPLQD